MNIFLNFGTYIPLTVFETVTNIKCEDRQEISSLTSNYPNYPEQQLRTEVPDVPEKNVSLTFVYLEF